MIAYKVCCIDDGHYFSAVLPIKDAVEYFLNRKSYPKKNCGKLCVFSDLESAINFCANNERKKYIFKCKIKKSKEQHIQYVYIYHKHINMLFLPHNTILADWVELIEEIK